MTTWPFLSHGRGHRTGTVLTQSFRTIFRRLQTSASSPGAICTAGAGGREGTVTCFASETTELTATEKPSLRCEPRPEPACSRTRATSSPSHALPGPLRAAPATLPRPWAADRPGSRAPFWRDRQAALTQRLLPPCPPPSLPAGGGTWHRPLWKLCSLPTRTQTVLGKEADRGSTTAQPLRPLRTQPGRAARLSYRAPVLLRQRGPAPERVDAVHCHQEAEGPGRALLPQLLEHDAHGVCGVPGPRGALRQGGSCGPRPGAPRGAGPGRGRRRQRCFSYLFDHLPQRAALLRALPLIPDVLLLGFYLKTKEIKTKDGYVAEG